MANFARHSYGTDWIPKYSENMWRMKKEDIERRRNAFGEQLKADTAMGTTLSPERQARADKEWGPGSGASFQRQSEYHKGQADAEKAEKDAENKAKLEQTALNQQVKVTDMGIKFVNMAVTTLNNGGMDGPAQDMFNRAQELLKKGGTEVDFSNILNSKEAKDKLSNGLMKTFTDILGKTDQDLTQANIRKVQAAYKKAEIGKVPGIENYSSVVQNLNTKLAAQKKQKQTENAAKAKRAQVMEDFRKKELFKQDLQAGEDDSEFAPDTNLYRNAETGATKDIDTRDKNAIAQAAAEGFFPIGPRAKGYLTQSGKFGAEREKEIVAGSVKARGKIATLNTLDTLLDRFRSGKLANIGKGIQQWASAFGIPVSKSLGAKEAFGAIVNELALRSRNLGEGMVLAGQMSDKDVQFLKDMNVQMIISKGGNKLILKIRKSIAQRELDIAREVSNYKKQNRGVFDGTGFEDFIRNKYSSKHIFGIPAGSVLTGTDTVTGLPVYEKDGKYFIPDF